MRRASCLLLLLAVGCGTSTSGVKPVSSPDPQAPCVGGRVTWNLRIADQRAEQPDTPRVVALIRDSLSHSLPACRWSDMAQAENGTITIEVHRFGTTTDGAVWEASAEWDVWVRNPGGQTLTEFEAIGEASRPNYRGENSERVAMQHALEEAMGKTLAGLRALSTVG
ncbi:MAG TPA: hypothetical protein VJA66_00810 [Thermoanaerobaculia bacterium]